MQALSHDPFGLYVDIDFQMKVCMNHQIPVRFTNNN
jgi:hypothetical protein